MTFVVTQRLIPRIQMLPDILARGMSFDDAIALADRLDLDYTKKVAVEEESAVEAEYASALPT